MYRLYQYIKHKAPAFNKPNIKAFYVKYMVIIGTIGQVMHYIQAWKIFTTKSASDISLAAYVISFFLLLNWMIYGVIISSKPLIYAEIWIDRGVDCYSWRYYLFLVIIRTEYL